MGGLAAVQPVGTEWHSHSPATTGCECVVKRLAVVPLVIVLLVPLVKISAMHDRENSLPRTLQPSSPQGARSGRRICVEQRAPFPGHRQPSTLTQFISNVCKEVR